MWPAADRLEPRPEVDTPMARHEHDREDLMREAVQLVPRAAWCVEGEPEEVIVGFRDEALSIYFGPDPVYHFNADGALRRAYVDGMLWKAEKGRLVVMQRQRSNDHVALRSQEQSPASTEDHLDAVSRRLVRFLDAIESGRAVCRQCEPDGAPIEPRLTEALKKISRDLRAADRPGLATGSRLRELTPRGTYHEGREAYEDYEDGA